MRKPCRWLDTFEIFRWKCYRLRPHSCFINHTVAAVLHLPIRETPTVRVTSQQKTTAMLWTLCAGAVFRPGKILGGLLPHIIKKFRCKVERKLNMYFGAYHLGFQEHGNAVHARRKPCHASGSTSYRGFMDGCRVISNAISIACAQSRFSWGGVLTCSRRTMTYHTQAQARSIASHHRWTLVISLTLVVVIFK